MRRVKSWLGREEIVMVSSHGVRYPAPSNLNYFWGFGSLALIFLIIQIATGLFLSMHYVANVDTVFWTIEHIMRDVNYGWTLRYLHSNGASFFFIVVYCHIARGLFYGSYMYPKHKVWLSGFLIFFLMMATAFLGYVLPWGQMSFWGATVITNLFSAIPQIGQQVAFWLWGGFSVTGATLTRFFSLHFALPFIILGVVFAHIAILHSVGSSNPNGSSQYNSYLNFYPFFWIKDMQGIFITLLFFFTFVHFSPNLLGHFDNYIEANALVTPVHIVPEWYFLPFYAILRSIPSKLGGVIAMVLAIVVMMFIFLLDVPKIRSGNFRPFFKIIFVITLVNFYLLGCFGSLPVEEPYVTWSRVSTFTHFFLFMFVIFVVSYFEFAAVSLRTRRPKLLIPLRYDRKNRIFYLAEGQRDDYYEIFNFTGLTLFNNLQI